MHRLALVLVMVGAGLADAAPRSVPLVQLGGVALAAPARAATFCDASRRAVLWLANGDVIAIDAAGRIAKLASVPGSGHLACDARDAVHLVTRGRIVTVRRGRVRSRRGPMDPVAARGLDDGVAVVDRHGVVHRAEGETWSVTSPRRVELWRGAALGRRGSALAAITAGHVVVYSADGSATWGPRALAAAWLDDSSLAVIDESGALARWEIRPSPASEPLSAPRRRAGRLELHVAGRRVVARNGRTLHIVDVGGTSHTVSRVPEAGVVAAGDAPFAVVARDRAYVIDLTRPHEAVDRWHPIAVSAMAFSFDGRSLAMLGGDDDVLVARIDRRGVVERRPAGERVVGGPLRWAADGTLVARGLDRLVVWDLDGTVRTIRERAIGIAPDGRVIAAARNQIRVGAVSFTVVEPPRARHEADATARFVTVGLSGGGLAIYEIGPSRLPVARTRRKEGAGRGVLVGSGARAMFVDARAQLRLLDEHDDKVIARLAGQAWIEASPDRELVAVGSERAVLIFDKDGRKRHALRPRGGRVTALAWSPDRRTLAVATEAGVELWIVPR